MTKVSVLTVLSLMAVSASIAGASVGDLDTSEADSHDVEAALKCDACTLVATKFGEAFQAAESGLSSGLSEKQVTEAAESVCDGDWHGYDTVAEGDAVRLAGPGTDRELSKDVKTKPEETENIWSHRMQDLCDELLAEVSSERHLYDTWSGDHQSALQQLLCKQQGTFGACTSTNWGPWPGDEDYDDDYDDGDFEYTHDEF